MSYFRLRWATAQQTGPSIHPANPRGSPLPWLLQNHVLVFPSHQISALLGWWPWWSTALPLAPTWHSGTGHPCPWEMWPPTPQTSSPAERQQQSDLVPPHCFDVAPLLLFLFEGLLSAGRANEREKGYRASGKQKTKAGQCHQQRQLCELWVPGR